MMRRARNPQDARGARGSRNMHGSRSSCNARDGRMHARDWAIALVIMAVYAVLAFCNLGDTRAAQNGYTTQQPNEQITFDFGEQTTLVSMQYYSYSLRVDEASMRFELSQDGETWEDFEVRTRYDKTPQYGFSNQFCWQDVNFWKTRGRAVRVTVPDAGVTFFEMAFRDINGNLLQPPYTVSSALGPRGAAGAPATAGAVAAANAPAASAVQPAQGLAALYDEQQLVPQGHSYLNSMYFDEIYHARTSYEMLHGLPLYETTHPPLGKLIIACSIAALGMTPFAWRLPGTIAGVLMLPLLYLIAKLLFRRSGVAAFAAGVWALDSMHFAQTRIATVDSFMLLFILAMFYFLLRYLCAPKGVGRQGADGIGLCGEGSVQLACSASATMRQHRRGSCRLMPLHAGDLLLAGLFMGLACATKWVGFYAAAGAAILLFVHWTRLGVRAHRAGAATAFRRWLAKTAGLCVVFFLIIPACLYFAVSWQPADSLADVWAAFWRQQQNMLAYHADLQDTHYFGSPWYEWPLDIRPMWWYDNVGTWVASTINTMGNPLVWWAGAAAMVGVFAYAVARIAGRVLDVLGNAGAGNAAGCVAPERAVAAERPGDLVADRVPSDLGAADFTATGPASDRAFDRAALFILVGYLCLLVPWVFVTRVTFIYHYFACTPFLALALAFALQCGLRLRDDRARKAVRIAAIAYVVLAAAAFAFFLPVVSGIEVSPAYIEATKWLPTWVIWE